MESDGRFTIYDLDTTNGTRLNGRKIDNRALANGDEILIGSTRIIFRQDDPSLGSHRDAFSGLNGNGSRIIVVDGDDDREEFILGSETVIGRAVTNDIVLPERAVATRHVRIRRGDPFTIEALDKGATTLLNGAPMDWNVPTPLRSGDRIGIGPVALRFEDTKR
jgi:pSer/pThr/pTyr-binding forkhead associated (FHA) protein